MFSGAVVTTMTKSKLVEETHSPSWRELKAGTEEELCLLACPASFHTNLPRHGVWNSRLGPLTAVSQMAAGKVI